MRFLASGVAVSFMASRTVLCIMVCRGLRQVAKSNKGPQAPANCPALGSVNCPSHELANCSSLCQQVITFLQSQLFGWFGNVSKPSRVRFHKTKRRVTLPRHSVYCISQPTKLLVEGRGPVLPAGVSMARTDRCCTGAVSGYLCILPMSLKGATISQRKQVRDNINAPKALKPNKYPHGPL